MSAHHTNDGPAQSPRILLVFQQPRRWPEEVFCEYTLGRNDSYHLGLVICRTTPVLLAFTLLLTSSCKEDRIQKYAAVKDPPPPRTEPIPQIREPVHYWEVPDSWQADESPVAPLLAAWDFGPWRITASRLGGTGGGALANINRWREQVGLKSVARLEDQPLNRLEIAGHPAALLDLAGAKGHILAVIYPRQDQQATWFFKMTGPADEASSPYDEFTAFVGSVRFDGE